MCNTLIAWIFLDIPLASLHCVIHVRLSLALNACRTRYSLGQRSCWFVPGLWSACVKYRYIYMIHGWLLVSQVIVKLLIWKCYLDTSLRPTEAIATKTVKKYQPTPDVDSMLFACRASVTDAGPTCKQHWVNVWYLLENTLYQFQYDSGSICSFVVYTYNYASTYLIIVLMLLVTSSVCPKNIQFCWMGESMRIYILRHIILLSIV